jgi:hypothetical protein
MNKQLQIAGAGFVLLLPAFVLVVSGLLEFDRPAALVHPVLVMGGLLSALMLNVVSLMRVGFGQDDRSFVVTLSIQVRGSAVNLAVLLLGCLLLATITAYLFVENFQPR